MTADDLKATGAMAVLLKDALQPNLVQTLEGNPAFVHGGPFANIAHGCNSVIATRAALKLGDYVVTEAGFGADLGAEKFLDIKCRQAGLKPDGGGDRRDRPRPQDAWRRQQGGPRRREIEALEKGLANLARHVAQRARLRPAGRRRRSTTSRRHRRGASTLIKEICRDELGVEAIICKHWAEGRRGAEELARKVVKLAEGAADGRASRYTTRPMPLTEKIETIARKIYGAADISRRRRARPARGLREGGLRPPAGLHGQDPVLASRPTRPCMGAPSGHIVPCATCASRRAPASSWSICGEIMTMPGLPRVPASDTIRLDANGQIEGLF